MVELKKISVKKRKVSNLNNWEMGNLNGGTGMSGCITYLTCDTWCVGTTNICISMALTMPCETYPKC